MLEMCISCISDDIDQSLDLIGRCAALFLDVSNSASG